MKEVRWDLLVGQDQEVNLELLVKQVREESVASLEVLDLRDPKEREVKGDLQGKQDHPDHKDLQDQLDHVEKGVTKGPVVRQAPQDNRVVQV